LPSIAFPFKALGFAGGGVQLQSLWVLVPGKGPAFKGLRLLWPKELQE